MLLGKLVHRHLKTTRHLDSVAPEVVVEVVVALVVVAVVTVALSTKMAMLKNRLDYAQWLIIDKV